MASPIARSHTSSYLWDCLVGRILLENNTLVEHWHYDSLMTHE